MKKLIIGILFLSGCMSKPILVRDCQPVQGDGGMFACKKL